MKILTVETVEPLLPAAPDAAHIIFDTIYFSADLTVLSEVEKEKIRGIAARIAQYPDKTFMLIGHAFFSGSVAERQRISLERAQAVAN